MIKEFKNGNSKWVSMSYCTTLISDSLLESYSPNGKDLMSSKKFIVPELSKSIILKALIRGWSMDKESIISQVHLLMLKLTLFKL